MSIDNNELVAKFFDLGDQIAELQDQKDRLRKQLVDNIPIGYGYKHGGTLYAWTSYRRKTTKWKVLYTKAYELLADDAQVIMGEEELNNKVSGKKKYWKFSRVKIG